MIKLDLRPGITKTEQYEAFKFPGGEVHLKLNLKRIQSITPGVVMIDTTIRNSDDLVLLMLAIDTIHQSFTTNVVVGIRYMAYQQADRKFSEGESFSLHTICKLLNNLNVSAFQVYDPHSDITPALLNKCSVVDNSDFIKFVLTQIEYKKFVKEGEQLMFLSPDAGAYKKIFKLACKLDFKGEIETASKSRNTTTNTIDSIVINRGNFINKHVLIIDDICVGGRTFIETAKILKDKGADKVYLAVSHGVFSNGFEELYKHVDHIFVTDSRYSGESTDRLTIYSL